MTKTPQTPALEGMTPLGIAPADPRYLYTCRCGDSAWNDIEVGINDHIPCEGCGDSPYRMCECGYIEGNIPRDSDLGHDELCVVLNPELLED